MALLHRLMIALFALSLLLVLPSRAQATSNQPHPNIVYVLCDDLGYGDIHCFNPEQGKIQTPHADALAKSGMMFTDAHSGSSVCTPTRYGLLTGRYSWRTRLQRGVVTGYAPNLIAEDRPTVASFMQSQGYHTAIIGKWHLDFQYLDPETNEKLKPEGRNVPPVGTVIPDGPTTRGFDYFHGFHHAREMEAVIIDDKVVAHDPPVNMLPRLTEQSVAYIDARAQDRKPFFLYVPLGSPHTPILPSPEWEGKSGLGKYADFVMQTDHALGEIRKALKRNGLEDNTIVIFTTDNGTSPRAGIDQLEKQGHFVSAFLRGHKADIWDGGHRIPFIIRWPGVTEPGSRSDQLICLTDLFATVADIFDQPLPDGSAEDSVSFLPALTGKPIESTRAGIVHHSIHGNFAYRMGDWKLALAKGSGGWSSPRENSVGRNAPEAQLYNMKEDVGETNNLYMKRPEIAARLLKQLESDVTRGRSTDGADSNNDIETINLWKSRSEE